MQKIGRTAKFPIKVQRFFFLLFDFIFIFYSVVILILLLEISFTAAFMGQGSLPIFTANRERGALRGFGVLCRGTAGVPAVSTGECVAKTGISPPPNGFAKCCNSHILFSSFQMDFLRSKTRVPGMSFLLGTRRATCIANGFISHY